MGQGSSSISTSSSLCPASFIGYENEMADLTLDLPDECLAWVFGKLGCRDRNNCSLVCRRWMLVDSNSRQRLVLVARSEMSPSLPALLSRFNCVSVLSLKCSRKHLSIDDDSLSRIPTFLPALKKLKLKGCIDVSDHGLHAFSLHRPPLLSKLSFASCGFGAPALISLLANCPSLQDLTLKRLRKLDAKNTPLSLDQYLGQEQNKKTIKNNQLTMTNQLQRLCLKDLHNARLFIPLLCSSAALKTLIVCRSSGNWDPVLESLLGRATTTSISEIQMENVQMGDAGLLAISASCPELQVLYLSRATDCTDDGLSAIANSCTKLRKFHVDAWSRFGSRTIGDEGIYSVATRCFQLQELVLTGVPITLLSLNVLSSNCPALERMALCNTDSVGDSEMAFIAAKFCVLKKLCIKNCPISDSGIESIGEGCPNLVKLKVKRCRGVTQASVSQLRLRRSSLIVSVDTGSGLFDGEGTLVAGDEVEDEGIRGRRMAAAAAAASALPNNTRSTRTHVLCSSRGAQLLRFKFGNALQLNRRPRPHEDTSNSRYCSSVHAASTSHAPR